MEIHCTNCGADVPIEAHAHLVKCPFCSAALVVDLSRGVKHYLHTPKIDGTAAAGFLEKRLAVIESQGTPRVVATSLNYLPYWQVALPGGARRLFCAATPPMEIMDTVPAPQEAGPFYDEEAVSGGRVMEPTLLMDAARVRAREAGIPGLEEDDSVLSLVHLPFLEVEYDCSGGRYRAWIEAITGEAYSDLWPPNAQRTKNAVLGSVAAISLVAFFAEAIMVPGAWILLTFPVTAVLLYLSTRTMLRRLGW